MKATELIIGNLVYYKGEVVKVGEIAHQGAYKILDGCETVTARTCMPYDEIKPIPITEEWLERFDGVKVYIQSIRGYSFGDLKIFFKGGCYNVTYVDGWIPCEEIKHVHQLQNLYFALTGKKLTIKENEKSI